MAKKLLESEKKYNFYRYLGARIASRRLELGISTEALAAKIAVPVDRLRLIEEGARRPNRRQLEALFRELSLNRMEVLMGVGDRPS